MSTTIKAKPADPCCCPVCTGLATFERPIFATGQTLTAADLTALQTYAAGKNRLHNRYLHGWGVVCGLEVLCDDCDGSVTIRPGYAIDPCGEDIVVAKQTRYDVVAAIGECSGQGRGRSGDCDPWVPPADPGCRDALSHWCIALRYREVEAAIGQRLTTGGGGCVTIGKGSSAGGCGCGGGSGCGGGCACQPAQVATSYVPSAISASNSCAPRRVMECFDITLMPSKEPCGPQLRRLQGSLRSDDNPLGLIGWLVPEKSLLRNIIQCLINDLKALTGALSEREGQIIGALLSQSPEELAASNYTLEEVHAAVCRVRGAMLSLLQRDSGTTRCQLLRAVAAVTLAPPPPLPPPPTVPGTTVPETTQQPPAQRQAYFAAASEAARDLLAAWIQIVLDCVCRAFLPRCEEEACDDRVELACLSVKDGKIIDICNFSCRRYAGAFPTTFYWMSLLPIVPLIARLLAMLCCQPALLRRNSPLVNDLTPLLATIDPTGKLLQAVTRDDFALPRRVLAMAANVSDTAVIPALAARLGRTGAKMQVGPGVETVAQDESSLAAAARQAAEAKRETEALRADLAALREQVTGLEARSGASVKAAGGKAAKTRAT